MSRNRHRLNEADAFYMEKDIDSIVFPESRAEIASLLEYDLRRLKYLLYTLPEGRRYKAFSIPKKDGSKRQIYAPVSAIKTIQQRLSDYLYAHYTVKSCAHGFVKGKDIVTNASRHRNRRWIVNIDLKDFFPGINFGRVRGAFLARPFNASKEAATLLAQICCFKGALPQGAPTSPIVSNIVCRQLDNKLIDFARANRLHYTRYADDITFSTNLKDVPTSLGVIDESGSFILDKSVRQIINDCGFVINEAKVHCSSRHHRQMVTGLVTNTKVNVPRSYIKQIRCMLHAYETYSLEKAAKEHFEKYSKRSSVYPELTFRKILAGKIGYLGHVKGKSDPLYLKLVSRMKALDPSAPLTIPRHVGKEKIIVYGEGKSDPLHLQAALEWFQEQGKYVDLSVRFHRYRDDEEVNNDKLFKMCETRPISEKDERIELFLFDRDAKGISSNKVEDNGKPKYWGNGVYSALLPRVPHREFNEICIEHYYQDADLKKLDPNGRRLYLSTEFDKNTGIHLTEEKSFSAISRLRCPYPRIIDSGVSSHDGHSVALSKIAFANNILQKKEPFNNMDFSAFSLVFDLLEELSRK